MSALLFDRQWHIQSTESYIEQIREKGKPYALEAIRMLSILVTHRENSVEAVIASILSHGLAGQNIDERMEKLSEDEAKFADIIASAVMDIVTASVD